MPAVCVCLMHVSDGCVYVYACMCVYVCMCIYVGAFACVCMFLCVCVYVCICGVCVMTWIESHESKYPEDALLDG